MIDSKKVEAVFCLLFNGIRPIHYNTFAYLFLVLIAAGCGIRTSEVSVESRPLTEYSETLRPELVYVVSGGFWQQVSISGSIRVLIYSGGYEHVSSMLYLQWLTDPTPELPGQIIASVHVKELDGIYSFVEPRIQVQDGAPKVHLSGVHSYTGESVRIVLETTNIGNYRIINTSGDP